MHLVDAPPIDPSFSVYKWITSNYDVQTNLKHRLTMHLVSHEIENATIVDKARNRIFSGFQSFSRFLPQVEHYKALAEEAEQVFVFGLPDVEPPPLENIQYIPLSANHKLAQEWFLVSYGPEYFSVLGAEELTEAEAAESTRLFRGSWTFDLEMAMGLEERLSQIVGVEPYDKAVETQNYASQIRLMLKSIERMISLEAHTAPERNSNWSMISGELRTAMRNDVQSAILRLSTPDIYSRHAERVAIICVSIGSFEATLREQQPISEHVDNVINPYFAQVAQTILDQGGTLNHFDDDRIFGFFDITDSSESLDFLVLLGKDIVNNLRKALPSESLKHVGIGIVYGEVIVNEVPAGDAFYRNVTGDLGRFAQRLSDVDADKIRISLSAYQQLEDQSSFVRNHSLKPHHIFEMTL